jgi:hypothetical protein
MSQSKRSAEQSLKGYLYQFQRSISRLIEQPNDSNRATFEHIEDLDLLEGNSLHAVQFKYLPSKKLTMSLVRWPILDMLNDDFLNQRNAKYELFIYAQENQTFSIATAADLKKLSHYRSEKKAMDFLQSAGIHDHALDSFLKRFSITTGMPFEASQRELVAVLKKQFSCSQADAKDYYYQNAIDLCLKLSTGTRPQDRTITKRDFCNRNDNKPYHFARWFAEMKSADAYIKHLRKRIRPITKKNSLSRLIILDCSYGSNQIAKFIKKLVDKSYNIPNVLYSVKPWSVVVKGSMADINDVKIALLRESIAFNDGHESIKFNVQTFEKPPILNESKSHKVIKASYVVRIVLEETYRQTFAELEEPDAVVCCSPNANMEVDYLRGSRTGHVYMASILNLVELEKILIL